MLSLYQCLRKVTSSCVIIGGELAYWMLWGRFCMGRIVQDRLKIVAEDVLPESQCGFRAGWGCIARQLVEKAREHQLDLFIDIKKVYDLVPRQAL